jgi:hypothetical protein
MSKRIKQPPPKTTLYSIPIITGPLPTTPTWVPVYHWGPHPLPIVAPAWSFWSFDLQDIRGTGGGYFAEVIFGVFYLAINPPKVLPPLQQWGAPLTNSNIVGVSFGAQKGWQCNGTSITFLNKLPIPFAFNQNDTTYGQTNVTVSNGVPTLNDLGAVFDGPTGQQPAYLSANKNAQIFYSPAYSASGSWKFKQSWGVVSNLSYSVSNPPLPIPGFPPGGEFSQ